MSATELVRRLAVRGKRLACELDDRIYCSRTVAATTRSHSSNRPGSQGPGASDSALLVSLDLSRELGWALREAARASGVAGVPGELPQQFDYLFRQVPISMGSGCSTQWGEWSRSWSATSTRSPKCGWRSNNRSSGSAARKSASAWPTAGWTSPQTSCGCGPAGAGLVSRKTPRPTETPTR